MGRLMAAGRSRRAAVEKPKKGCRRMAAPFRWALSGIWQATRTQRNMKIHWAAAVGAIGLGAWLGLGPGEWAAVVLSCAAVLGAECMNTAVEAAVDLASPGRHPLAKRAKDCAAGAVLLCAIGAAATGVVVFGGKMAARWGGDGGTCEEGAAGRGGMKAMEGMEGMNGMGGAGGGRWAR